MTNRFKMVASVYLFLMRDNKILLLERQNTGYADGKYGLPSGHTEDGESITAAISREVEEEIGMSIHPRDFTLVHVMHRKEEDIRMDFFFVAKKIRGKPVNGEPHKCSDLEWFSFHKLPSNIIPYIRKAIENYQKKIIYSEIGW